MHITSARVRKAIIWLAGYSYTIYLVHSPLSKVLIGPRIPAPTDGWSYAGISVLMFGATLLAALVFAVIADTVVLKPCSVCYGRYGCRFGYGAMPRYQSQESQQQKRGEREFRHAKAGIKRFSRFHAALAATRENTVEGAETASEASEASDICPTIYEVLVVIERYLKAVLEGS